MWKNQRQIVQVNISMISLKWGDVLSMLLLGAVALAALGSWIPVLNEQIKNFTAITVAGGFALLMAAVLVGGVLGAFTRVAWERYVLVRFCRPKDVLSKLTPENVALYERGVEGSYKYALFYANFAWAVVLLLVGFWHRGYKLCSLLTLVLIGLIALLLTASYIQWTYYVNYQTKVIREETTDAGQRPASGDES